jgi:LCP family protein required for cell wall assembly
MLLLVIVGIVALGAGGVFIWFNWVVGKAHQGPGFNEGSAWVNSSTAAGGQAGTTVSTVVEKPGSMDILVMGSDDREEGSEEFGRSDTLMLVHVDSKADFVSVLSLPRDLKVEIPGYGTQKINAAYSFGGPALAMETVLQSTGVRVDHFVNVGFDAFREMTTALGGIYVDVDVRYYNPQNPEWETIDIWPGYQRLSGEDALDYVRFRHDLNYDFGRIDRQQRFLRAVKEQALGWDLVIKAPQLVTLFASNVSTEISTTEALRLLLWAIGLNGSKIKQVYLQAGVATVDGASYVVATDEALQAAIRDLSVAPGSKPASVSPLVGEIAPDIAAEQRSSSTTSVATTSTTTAAKVDLKQVSVEVLNANGRTGEAALAADRLRAVGATVDKVGDAGLTEAETIVAYPSAQKAAAAEVARVLGGGKLEVDTTVQVITVFLGEDFDPAAGAGDPATGGTIPNQGEWKALAAQRPFPLMAPSYIPPDYKYKDRRTYDIDTEAGPKPALKMVYQFQESDQYLGIMETTFLNAPAALDGEKVTQNGITYTLVAYGGRVDHVWWKKDGVIYWISNTLSYLLDKEEMVKMATSMVSVSALAN